MKSLHKHHIIPKYHCKKLGIDPDFDENIVEVDRLDHARIHWGYKCDDLEPLFEYITPAQWIIDLIPRGDNRDVGAAVLTAKGELDEIVPLSGEEHPNWGKSPSLETRKKMSDNNAWIGKKRPEHAKFLREAYANGDLQHPMKGKHISDETKKKISIANVGDKNSMFGKTHTTEARESIRQARLGTTASKETREKMSKMRKGKDTWNKGKKCSQLQGDKNGMFGKIPWNKGKTGVVSEETRKKMSENRKGIAPWNKGTGMTKEERNKKARERYARKKAERQGVGTLDAFLK